MKKFYIIYIFLTALIWPMQQFAGQQFTEDFDNNNNDWYINKNKSEEVYIENGNYIIKNLDESSDLSLSITQDVTDFFAQEYIWKKTGKNNSLYGIFIELDTKDRFYFILSNQKIAYLYEKDGKLGVLEEFKKFPYLSEDYNSIIFLKDKDNFTFLINQIPTEEVWTISSAKIQKIGVYIGDLTNLYIDKYSIFKL